MQTLPDEGPLAQNIDFHLIDPGCERIPFVHAPFMTLLLSSIIIINLYNYTSPNVHDHMYLSLLLGGMVKQFIAPFNSAIAGPKPG